MTKQEAIWDVVGNACEGQSEIRRPIGEGFTDKPLKEQIEEVYDNLYVYIQDSYFHNLGFNEGDVSEKIWKNTIKQYLTS